MKTYKLVKNDTNPRLIFTITKNGSPISLTGATVRLKFRKQSSDMNIFSRVCTVSDAANGQCYYDWQSGDLANTGAHRGEVEITFADGSVQTCKDLLRFDVRDEL